MTRRIFLSLLAAPFLPKVHAARPLFVGEDSIYTVNGRPITIIPLRKMIAHVYITPEARANSTYPRLFTE